MPFCCDCIHWMKEPEVPITDFGTCDNIQVEMKAGTNDQTILQQDGKLQTNKYFGCIHWAENDGSLLNVTRFAEVEAIDRAKQLGIE